MEKNESIPEKHESIQETFKKLDWPLIVFPLIIVIFLCTVFLMYPDRSTEVTNNIRGFLGNDLGAFYIVMGFGTVLITLFIAFSRFGKIRLGKSRKPVYNNYQWAVMIFIGVFASDLIFYSIIEWALYAGEMRIEDLGGIQAWASTYPLFHWGPVPWSFYVMLGVAFGFMLHVRHRKKKKFSESCRALLGDKVDKLPGKVIDFIAILALVAGTATTFSLATPLLSAAFSAVTGVEQSSVLTIGILITIATIYCITVLNGMKGILKASVICNVMFMVLLAYVLLFSGEARYIIETGVTAIGNLAQNFIGLSTWMDPLRLTGDGITGFAQNWTVFYWAYWMAWCVATPFFVGMISEGRTIQNVVLGTYLFGLAGTYLSFTILGNYGLSQQMAGNVDIISIVADGRDIYQGAIEVFGTLPNTTVLLVWLFFMLILFYSTTFDSITLVVSMYSYKHIEDRVESAQIVRVFWAIIFIIFPIGLIFAENTINSLQSVAIIAAFPIGIIFCMIVASFFKDADAYLHEMKMHPHSED